MSVHLYDRNRRRDASLFPSALGNYLFLSGCTRPPLHQSKNDLGAFTTTTVAVALIVTSFLSFANLIYFYY